MSSARAVLFGFNNKLYVEDAAAHEWYRFVLSYPPHLVRDYIRRFGLTSDNCLLDPFCGTGTTIVEGIADSEPEERPLFNKRKTPERTPALRTLPEESLKLLLTDSISPLPLH